MIRGAKLLAIDTSTSVMALAVGDDERVDRVNAAGGASASARLIADLLALLTRRGWQLGDLDAIAFGSGPGAFTGLRTACAVAQGLALGAGKPVLALDSLLVVAEDARFQARSPAGISALLESPLASPLWVAMDARMDEIYAAAYQPHPDGWQCLVPPALYTLDALNARWRAAPPGALAGSAIEAFGARLLPLAPRDEGPGPGPASAAVPLPCFAQQADRAAVLWRLARAAWHAGGAMDAQQALPVYLRDKVALTTLERGAAARERAAAGAVTADAAVPLPAPLPGCAVPNPCTPC
jgi:tRNA threonylcarbamoyladenosine biosynthesis protein TsaB